MRCVLVSCCGLPAAGKTTFCRSVVSESTTTSAVTRTSSTAAAANSQFQNGAIGEGGAKIQVSHVCFDEHIDRARQRRRRRGKNSPTCTTHHLQHQQEEEEDEEESTYGQEERKDCSRGSDERDDYTDKKHKYSTSAGDTGTIYATHRSENDNIETRWGTETVQQQQCAMLPDAAPVSEGSSKDGARWWHEGRQAALAEIEAFAAQAQVGVATLGCKASLMTASSMTANTVASAVNRRGRRKDERISGAINPASATTPASTMAPAEMERSIDSVEIPKHEVANAAATMEMTGAMVTVSASNEESTMHVVLADDNMHFRSMRHEVFRLARKCASSNGV